MPDRDLHSLDIPSDSQLRSQAQIQRNVATSGALAGGVSPVEAVSLQPNERLLAGQYRAKYSAMMAQEIEELFDAPDIESVPLFSTSTTLDERGYYALENADVRPMDPRVTDAASRFDGVLRKEGTRKSHWRAMAIQQTQIDTPFGNDQTVLVGIDADASEVRWMHPTTKATESASVHSTETTEFGDVDRYDAAASNFSHPVLIYALDYAREAKTDCLVYDDRGNASRTDSDSVLQWQRVFRTDHDFENKIVVTNHRIRFTFDESNNDLSVEEYTSGSWSSLSLGTSGDAGNWQVLDVDLTYLGLSRIRAQVIWQDTSDDSTFHLNFQLPRGYDRAQWFNPDAGDQGSTPSGLETKLDPTAFGQVFSAQSSMTLQERKEVRK